MSEQLAMNLQEDEEYMLWYENGKTGPEQAIQNAGRYYLKKYGVEPFKVRIPPEWRGKEVDAEELEEALGLIVRTDKNILPQHVEVYSV